MESHKLVIPPSEIWRKMNREVDKINKQLFNSFYNSLQDKLSLLQQNSLTANLWTQGRYDGGIGSTFDPRIYWCLRCASLSDNLKFEYHIGRGLYINLDPEILSNKQVEIINELLPFQENCEKNSEYLREIDIFNFPKRGNEKVLWTEIWEIGTNAEKYSTILFDFLKPILANKEIIS